MSQPTIGEATVGLALRPFRRQLLHNQPQLVGQGGQIDGGNVPDLVVVQAKVIVAEHVSQSGGLPPRDFMESLANCRRNVLGGFSQDEEFALNRSLKQPLCGKSLRCRRRDEGRHVLARVDPIVKV